MTKKIMALLAPVLAALAVLLAACTIPQPPQKLILGKWQADGYILDIQAMEFREDGTCSFGPFNGLMNGTYAITLGVNDAPDTISLTYKILMLTNTDTYEFTVTDTTLNLKKQGSSLALSLSRVPQAVTTAAVTAA
jgi:hypothetical protein